MGIGKVDKGEGSVEGEVWRWSARNLCAVVLALSSGSDGNSPRVSANLKMATRHMVIENDVPLDADSDLAYRV